MNILLTEYGNLFTNDFFLPTGDLRDLRSSYKRADIIIVTKCKADLSKEEKEKIKNEIKPLSHQQLFFTTIQYDKPYHILTKKTTELSERKEVLLVTGIANPKPLKKLLEEQSKSYYIMHYPDHHIFTIDDLKEIKKRFENIEANDKIILSTEKDSVRLMKFNNDITDLPFYIIPAKHKFLFDEDEQFKEIVTNFIQNFKPAS